MCYVQVPEFVWCCEIYLFLRSNRILSAKTLMKRLLQCYFLLVRSPSSEKAIYLSIHPSTYTSNLCQPNSSHNMIETLPRPTLPKGKKKERSRDTKTNQSGQVDQSNNESICVIQEKPVRALSFQVIRMSPVRPGYSAGDTSFAASVVPPSGYYSGGFYTGVVLSYELPSPHRNIRDPVSEKMRNW